MHPYLFSTTNIGSRVDLTDFTFDEALPLADGLELPPEPAQQVLRRILHWTNGHPYLTQQLCQALATQREANVDLVVQDTFFGNSGRQDHNLQFVRDMLTRRSPDPVSVLTTYREILRGKPTIFDEEQSLTKSHLKLSGIACREENRLRVRNLIYRKIFDDKWIKENLPTRRPPIRPVFLAGIVVTAVILLTRFFGVFQPLELWFYDHLMQLQSGFVVRDSRFLIVEVTESDVRAQEERGEELLGSLSNETLARLLEKLDEFEPRAYISTVTIL